MRFALLQANWTNDAASIWGDMLELDRPATFIEAKASFDMDGTDGNFADYFDDTGAYKGPCALGISVEDRAH